MSKPMTSAEARGQADIYDMMTGPSEQHCKTLAATLRAYADMLEREASFEWYSIERFKQADKDIPLWVWLYVPPKAIPSKGGKTRFTNARQLAGRWVCPAPGNGHALSDHAKELIEKHGGFWSSDSRGRSPIVGSPSHWAYLPPPPTQGAQP